MPIPCAVCNMPLPKWELATGNTATCTLCGAPNEAHVFPAAFAPTNAPATAEGALEGQAACYDHPSKRAVAACSQCGRFVCKLCSVEFGTDIWCPSCVAAGAGRAKSARQDTSRTLYDSTALIVPLVALIIYPLTLVAAPASLVLTAMRWKRPLSLVRRNRWRFLAAIVVSVGEIAGWTAVVIALVYGRLMGAGS